MDTPFLRRAEAAFYKALARPAEERSRYVEEVCSGDESLQAMVNRLLEAHEEADSGIFAAGLTARAGEAADAIAAMDPELAARFTPVKPEEAGDRIGHYTLLQQLGEGGFGTVWMAEQAEPVRRQVALKIIKLGMDTKEVIARFGQERQALALMEHPNIAKCWMRAQRPRAGPSLSWNWCAACLSLSTAIRRNSPLPSECSS